ncbi:MFS transporter [Duganella sp. FT92W]|uniref:MFS transporter n=2 Tax=Pseudoduganella rivuli TaxID=2666085 RepID=A0A7X2IQM2_9BURK|nr:MFS transporter [Pseudoduganella rivuli]
MAPAAVRPGQARVVGAVMACHFVAAFAALGMPPFFSLILSRSLHSDAAWLAGWLYIVPTFFTALSSPWWGRLADRYGKKRLLLRAQFGLAASFALAGVAQDTATFALALVLQGLLGGTFSASNAYLATVVQGPALMRSLTWMQWSARAALFAAPAALGVALPLVAAPLALYRWLALLPLAAALCIWWMPEFGNPQAGARAAGAVAAQAAPSAPAASARQLYALQWLFVFATVLTFPYCVPWLHEAAGASVAQASLLFGLPHLVYLACAIPLTRWLGRARLLATLGAAFALLAVALPAQAWSAAHGWPALAAWRVAMGLGMTAAYLALHGLIAAMVNGGNAGRTFGWFESSSKWGAVAAGLGAGVLVQAAGMRAPFIAGGVAMLAAACFTAWIASSQFHMNNRSRHAND